MAKFITSAIDYTPSRLAPLITSFMCNTTIDELHVLVAKEDFQGFQDYIQNHNRITISSCETMYKTDLPQHLVSLLVAIKSLRPYRLCRNITRLLISIGLINRKYIQQVEVELAWKYSLRWPIYETYLAANFHPDETIIMLDARDCLLLSDVTPLSTPLLLSCEPHNVQFGANNPSSVLNTKWFRDLFSNDEYSAVKGKSVVCAGVIAGHTANVISVLKYMNNIIDRELPGVGPRDQAILNYVAYRYFEDFIDSRCSNIMHIAAMNESESARLLDDISNGVSSVTVLHQYDRHSNIADYFTKSNYASRVS
jgi:hypothetical protein